MVDEENSSGVRRRLEAAHRAASAPMGELAVLLAVRGAGLRVGQLLTWAAALRSVADELQSIAERR